MAGLTLDTGALIDFERSRRRVMTHLAHAERRGLQLTVPTVVIAEAWRGGSRSARIANLLGACVVEALLEPVARAAGEAMATLGSAGVVDAIVMASAAQRGDRVLTSDFEDLDRLRSCFPEVRLLTLG